MRVTTKGQVTIPVEIRKKYQITLDTTAHTGGLQERTLPYNQETISVKYSYLDMGPIENIFDGHQDTLIRTMEANPLVVEITPPQAEPIHRGYQSDLFYYYQ